MLEQNRDIQPMPDPHARLMADVLSPAITPVIRSTSSSSSSLQEYYYFASPDEQPIYTVPTSSTGPPPWPPRRRSEHVYEDPMDGQMEYANIGVTVLSFFDSLNSLYWIVWS